MMKVIFLFVLSMYSLPLWTQEESCDLPCQSQLVRMEIDNSLLQSQISSDSMRSTLLPAVDRFLRSDTFQTNFVKKYPIDPMPVPFNKELCLSDKARGSVRYLQINCDDKTLCSNASVPEEIKAELCFSLPCAMIKGSRLMGECLPRLNARPVMLNFTDPFSLKNLEMTPLSISAEGNTIRSCFRIDKLESSVGIGVDFDQATGVSYERLGMSNIQINLDSPREVCMSARVDLTATPAISQIKVETPPGQNFVSEDMIDEGLSEAAPYGLSGYPPETLNVLKATVAPPILRHFTPTIEEAVKFSLGQSFELQLSKMIGDRHPNGSSSVNLPADTIIHELGMANMAVKKYVDLMECSLDKIEDVIIPELSPCLTKKFLPRNRVLRLRDIPTPEAAANLLSQQMERFDRVTSETIKARIEALKPRLQAKNKLALYDRTLEPLANQIVANRPEAPMLQGLKLITGLSQSGTHTAVGISLPKLCNTEAPSLHAAQSIPDCPIQTYVDLEEMNRVLSAMYESGRLCHQGQGDYEPERDSRGRQVYNRDDSPRGRGCHFIIEEDPEGMRCFLNGAPKLKFDSATTSYKVEFKTKDCFRGPVFAGQGKLGGDINFDIGFTPTFEDGDFVLSNSKANWSVVPGTARYALREESFFNGIVKSTIDKEISKVLKEAIRIPLTRTQGPLSNVPLIPDGRVDTGPGYFGACLKFR
jgi:hypothetical protein